MDQNKVIVLARSGKKVPYAHTNIKVLNFNGPFFLIAALAYILSNRSTKQQKKTDFLFTDDKSVFSLFKAFDRFIPADIVFSDSFESLTEEALASVNKKKEKDKAAII
jgi:hypothetical protein